MQKAMKEILINKLHQYISHNNPDVLVQLEEDGVLSVFLTSKVNTVDTLINQLDKGQPAYIIEDACMDVLTQDLKPSKYNYICNIMEEEFEDSYLRFVASGVLRYEVINLINYCRSVFEDLNFAEENEDNRFTHYAISGMIDEYLQVTSERENVSDELQQSTKTEG
jgi:hypothetical protein